MKHDQGQSPSPTTSRRAILAAGAGLGTAGLLTLLGPHPVAPAPGRSGDLALLARTQPHLRGFASSAITNPPLPGSPRPSTGRGIPAVRGWGPPRAHTGCRGRHRSPRRPSGTRPGRATLWPAVVLV